MKLFGSLITLLLPSITLAGLYYPPILSPKAGDLIAIGSNFTVIWYLIFDLCAPRFTNQKQEHNDPSRNQERRYCKIYGSTNGHLLPTSVAKWSTRRLLGISS